MTEISVGFTTVTPGSPDPDMHFGLEVKWLNEEGQQILTSAMAEVLNNHSINGQCFPIKTIITRT